MKFNVLNVSFIPIKLYGSVMELAFLILLSLSSYIIIDTAHRQLC